MEGYIDIHSHILPGLDDGADSLERTIRMLEIAYGEGIRTMIATPHYRESRKLIPIGYLEETLGKVEDEIAHLLPDMKIYMGSEVFYSHNMLSLLRERKVPTLGGSRYVLVEFVFGIDFTSMKNGLQELLYGGYQPILAHGERYPELMKDLEQVMELKEMGISIQVNSMNIIRSFGKHRHASSKKLFQHDLVDFLATDCHSDSIRAPVLKNTLAYLKKRYGDRYIEQLLVHNPKRILQNK